MERLTPANGAGCNVNVVDPSGLVVAAVTVPAAPPGAVAPDGVSTVAPTGGTVAPEPNVNVARVLLAASGVVTALTLVGSTTVVAGAGSAVTAATSAGTLVAVRCRNAAIASRDTAWTGRNSNFPPPILVPVEIPLAANQEISA